jgi:hypothetical protein
MDIDKTMDLVKHLLLIIVDEAHIGRLRYTLPDYLR